MIPVKEEDFAPHILVAMPSLQDGYFDKSVILLCEYNANGAMGFVINSPSSTSVDDLLGELGLNTDPPQSQQILIGGPVQSELCWVVHSPDFHGKSTTLMGDALALSAAQEVLTSIAEGSIPATYLLGVGPGPTRRRDRTRRLVARRYGARQGDRFSRRRKVGARDGNPRSQYPLRDLLRSLT